jgi:aspartyl-tRNA(Asn)/glutamyl-tRNA(Gln) amidotransferase subunit A
MSATKRLEFASLLEAGALLRARSISSVELTRLMLDRIAELDSELNAFITVTTELALQQAARADAELADGKDRGPLHGIPIAIKDLFATKGVLTTGGSKYYESWIPDYDSTTVAKLSDAGAVLLGKTGLHELAFGSTSINPWYGAIANPWKLDHHPGGSSGGSAVAVAAGMAYAAIGSDTGCSVRQPAQCCGIVGLKPSYGLVSLAGVMPLVSSMDHVGPLTRTVGDAAAVLAAIQGYDDGDPASVDRKMPDYTMSMSRGLDGTTVGVPREFFFSGGDAEVVEIVSRAIEQFSRIGANVIDIELKDAEEAYLRADVTFSEIAISNGPALEDNPEAFSDAFRRRFEKVTKWSDDDYDEAQQFRAEFRANVEEILDDCDVLATPTSTVAAAPIAEQPRDHDVERRKNTCVFNFTGQPSISVPCGFTEAGLPVGLMLTGSLFEDGEVLRFARAFEDTTEWHDRHPDIG